jgi:hypothetical protein
MDGKEGVLIFNIKGVPIFSLISQHLFTKLRKLVADNIIVYLYVRMFHLSSQFTGSNEILCWKAKSKVAE